MDKGLQEVINKLKATQNSQPTTKPIEKPTPVSQPALMEEEDDADDEEFYEDTEKKPASKPVSDDKINKAELEMELLQNNGRFRAELLFQLQELNKALGVIAQVLMLNK